MKYLKQLIILTLISFFMAIYSYPDNITASRLQTDTEKMNINKENKEEVPSQMNNENISSEIPSLLEGNFTYNRDTGTSTYGVKEVYISPPKYSDGPDNRLKVTANIVYDQSDPNLSGRVFVSESPRMGANQTVYGPTSKDGGNNWEGVEAQVSYGIMYADVYVRPNVKTYILVVLTYKGRNYVQYSQDTYNVQYFSYGSLLVGDNNTKVTLESVNHVYYTPPMKMTSNPIVYNVYEDYSNDTTGAYTLSNIPAVNDTGKITFTYPDSTKSTKKYIADSRKISQGTFEIPRSTLPKELNKDSGTIKKYTTSIKAINEKVIPDVSSNDHTISINVYNIGAKAKPQIIKKGTPFSKKPEELIKDAVILPGNKAIYEYEGELPDTSVLGLTSVLVRMTDKERPEKTVLIKVPVEVISGTPPTSGLYLAANNYSSMVQELQGITEAQVAELILTNSKAVAWDVGTGSTENIKISVSSTTLKPNSPVGTYNASIKAVQGSRTQTKVITITVLDKQTVKVEFLDELGESIHEPISLRRTIGTTIDLTKEVEVQTVITELQNKRFRVYQRPENETALIVPDKNTTVAYQFEGTLFVSSYPSFMNFGAKLIQSNTSFIQVEKARYDKPLTIWDNRKGNKQWVLTATLEKTLTSEEDNTKTLPEAIRYKKDQSTIVVLRQGTAEQITTKKNQEIGDINISEGWDSGDSGLQLQVPTSKILQTGKYYATILWQVAEIP